MSQQSNQLPKQLSKEGNNFILRLNKNIYSFDIIQKALIEDKDWVEEIPELEQYFCVKLNTSDLEDVLNWANYLIYINKG